jgi:hypothetical protein
MGKRSRLARLWPHAQRLKHRVVFYSTRVPGAFRTDLEHAETNDKIGDEFDRDFYVNRIRWRN